MTLTRSVESRSRRLFWLICYTFCIGALVGAIVYRVRRCREPAPLTLDVVIEPGPTVWR